MSETTATDNWTTAQIIGAFRKNLIAEGVPDYTADELVIFAGRQVIADGPLEVSRG